MVAVAFDNSDISVMPGMGVGVAKGVDMTRVDARETATVEGAVFEGQRPGRGLENEATL